MKQTMLLALIFISLTSMSFAQHAAGTAKQFIGAWQLTKATDLSGQLAVTRSIVFKIYAHDAKFNTYAMQNGHLFQTANGQFIVRSAAVYEEQLERSIYVKQKEPVPISFKFNSEDELYIKFHVNNTDVEEVWRRVKYPSGY